MKIELVPNARQVALQSYSQWAQYAALSIVSGYQVLPAAWQEALPVEWVMGLAGVALVLGIFGRLIAQPGLSKGQQ